jgi:uncharacterized RDD family membrane protein YckC
VFDTSANLPSWPGERLGLPESGPRSIARLGRRLAAVSIDWALVVLLSVAFFSYSPLSLLLLFVALQIVPLVVINATVGHLILGLRLQRVVGGRLGVWPPVLRSVLLALVIPALFFDVDQRGIHDRAAKTILLRR